MEQGKLFVLSGPSGVGKGTVVSRLTTLRSDVAFSVSVTTREPRKGETEGKEYFFVNWDRFDDMVANGELLEHAEYVGNGYGTPREYVQKMLDEGINVLLDIEVQGARQVHSVMPEAVFIFVAPPSLSELENRLRSRGTETERAIEARLLRARQEFEEADFYDYLLVNDEVDNAANKLSAIITAEHCRFADAGTILNMEMKQL